MNTPELLRQLLEKKENQKLALQEDLILEVTNRICQLMDEQGVSRADLAKELGTSRAYVTGLLSGQRNMTLRTLADVFHVLGRRAEFGDSPFHLEELVACTDQQDDSDELIRIKFPSRSEWLGGVYRFTELPLGDAGALDKVAV